MKTVLVILAHPDEKSFNAAVAARCAEKLSENGYRPIEIYSPREVASYEKD